jgi:GT2 family glycosyltransferase
VPVELSLVMATFNRRQMLERLLRQLARQTLPAAQFEVVVVDDGSKEPVEDHLQKLAAELPYRLVVETQKNAGAAAARHRGIVRASGDLIVITDDDMQVDPDYLQLHLEAHRERRCVAVGQVRPDPNIGDMCLFERWYAERQVVIADRVRKGLHRMRGNSVITGNLSLLKADYLAVGGFDRTLGQSEDFELGLRLEKAGIPIIYLERAHVFHGSDHVDRKFFMLRAQKYGVFESRISHKHPEMLNANPWRYFFQINALARPAIGAAFVFPKLADVMAQATLAAAEQADELGMETVAFRVTSMAYTMEYYRGVRTEAGSMVNALKDLARFIKQRASAG